MKKKNIVVLGLVFVLLLLAGCNITPMLPKYQLTITVMPDSTAGSVNPTSGTKFVAETEVELVPTAKAGWKFDHWDGPNANEVVIQGSTYKILMNSHKSLTAVFKQENQAPTVSLTATPLTGNPPLEVSFTATATDPNNDALVYDWDFGDGVTTANGGSTQNHTYQTAGSYTAKVTVKDTAGLSATAQAVIQVLASNNHNPVATDDALTISEDQIVDIDVLANDSDEDSDTLTISSVTEAAHGTASILNGKIHYESAANYSGSDSLSYTIQDGKGGADTATVTLTIDAVNDAPIAVNDIIQLPEEGSILIEVLANDTDVDGDSLILESFTQGSSGTVTREGNALRYAPGANFIGEDQFTYIVNDGKGATATATVTVTVEPVNDAPVATVDTAELAEDGTIVIDVLANDYDSDGDTLSIVEFTQGTEGTVAQEGSALRYTPALNYNGLDSFTYKVSDGKGGVDSASVTVGVIPVNDAPAAVDDTAQVAEDSNVLITVLTNDSDVEGDALTVKEFTQGSHGTVVQDGTALRYTPVANFNGPDSFTYTVADESGATKSATVNVTVTPVNDAPAVTSDTAVVDEDGSVLINVLANDTDLDGDALSIGSLTQGIHGTVTQEASGLRYTPAANFNGADSFSYTVSDGNGGTATGNVNVTVNAVNDAPVAVNDSILLDEDSNKLTQVLSNDTDVDGDTMTVTSFTAGSHGAVVKEGNALRYTPAANFYGSDSFTYTMSDGKGGTATGTVSVTVSPVNDAPAAQNDSAQLHEGGTALIDVLANDSDIDNDPLAVTTFTQGSHGTVIKEGTGLRYTVVDNYNGQDQFTYNISDGKGGTATATVTLLIDAENDAPVANNDTVEVNEDQTGLISVLLNDTDLENDPLTISGFTQPGHGVVATEGTSLRYTPTANYNGSDSFTYTVSDGLGGEDTGTVTVTVNPVNDSPAVQNDAVTIAEDVSGFIAVLANDSDIDGDILTISQFTQGSHGMVNQEGDALRYFPAENYNGTDSITYTVSDGNGGTATATVNITVNPVNDAPAVSNDTVMVNENNTVLIDVLANDSDVEGNALTVVSFTQGSHGAVAKEGSSLRYTPAANYNGADSFTYEVSDGNGGVVTGTVNVTVNSVNDAPVANNDSATLNEDGTALIDVLANDSDIDGNTLTVTAFTQGAHGAVAKEGDSLRYTPVANYSGTDSFTYTMSDGNGGTATATVNVTINALNDAPAVINDTADVNEDSSVLISVLANDSDVEGDTLTIASFTQGTHGTVAKEGNSLRYTPAVNYSGADTFTYEVSDGNGGVTTGTVNVTVNTVNDAPVAINDSTTINEDSTTLLDVLANDSDIDGNTLTVTAFTQGAHGVVAKEGDSLRYTPVANYSGTDSFTYTMSDGNGGTATATVNVTINALNDAPVVSNESVEVNEDSTILISVLANDSDVEGDTLTIASFTQGTHGTVAKEGNSLRYTPAVNYNGADTFTYEVSDGNGGVTTGTVNVTVLPINDAPVAANDGTTLDEDSTTLLDVLANDSDIDGNTLTITAFTQGAHGVVAKEGDSLRYTPVANYSGTDSFTYTMSDGNGGTATATVNVTINALNDAPAVSNESVEVNEDSTILISVLANDSDVEGDTLTIASFTQGTHGTVAKEGNSLRYTPAANYSGADTFTYEVSDGIGGVTTGTVNVTVNTVNDAPVAANDSTTLDEDSTTLLDVLANDSDIDGDTLTITAFTQGAHGVVAKEGDSLRYTPVANYSGTDSFTYTMSDGNGGTATATVNVTINSLNDAPTVSNDTADVNEDSSILISVLANDSDIEGDILSISSFTQGAHGSVAQEGNSLRYLPAANYNGADSFTYNISDGNGGTDAATVNITILSVNDQPVAVNDSGIVNEDGTVLFSVVANDSDVDGDALSITANTQGANGSVALEGNALSYTPEANYHGADSFTYTISDGQGATASATVSVTINSVNDAPVANPDDAELDVDSTTLVDVLANDTDVDGDARTLVSCTQGAHGMVSVEVDMIRYTPDAGYTGSDSFTYTISDGNGGSSTATVNMTVNSVGPLLAMDIENDVDGSTDRIPVTITHAGTYQFQTSFYLVDCDTCLTLYDVPVGGESIAENDDINFDEPNYYSCIVIFLEPGTYYIWVQTFDGSVALNCHLEVMEI